MFIRATAGATSCEFAVNDDSRDAANAVILRFGGYLRLMHVVDYDLV
jgi:hypothetical protein